SQALILKPFRDDTGKKYGFAFQTLSCDSNPAIEEIAYLEESNTLKIFEFSRDLVKPTYDLINQFDIIVLALNNHNYVKNRSFHGAVDRLAKYLNAQNNQLL